MNLPTYLIKEFVKSTNDTTTAKKEKTVYGTAMIDDGDIFVRLDGSDISTPVLTTTNVSNGERVTVMIKNHNAVITGNVTSPAAKSSEVQNVSEVTNSKVSQTTYDNDMTEVNNALATKLSSSVANTTYAKKDFSNVDDATIPAAKIQVTDLHSLATLIGGINIGTHTLYSDGKLSVSNTSAGFYLNDDGEVCIGDSSNMVKFYNDNSTWKMSIILDGTEVLTRILNASKTATDFLDISNNVVILGDRTQNQLGTNIKIDQNGLHICDEDTDKASIITDTTNNETSVTIVGDNLTFENSDGTKSFDPFAESVYTLVTGILPSVTDTVYLSYPTGYDDTNCVVINTEIKYDNTEWQSGNILDSTIYTSLSSSGVGVYLDSQDPKVLGQDVRVLLMKI